jgi:hypothetical protein
MHCKTIPCGGSDRRRSHAVPVVLENETNSTDSPENVTVKSGASVIVAHDISLFDQGGDGIASKSTDGWNVTVEKGATVKSVDGGNNAAINLRFTTGATVTNSGELTGVSGALGLAPTVPSSMMGLLTPPLIMPYRSPGDAALSIIKVLSTPVPRVLLECSLVGQGIR